MSQTLSGKLLFSTKNTEGGYGNLDFYSALNLTKSFSQGREFPGEGFKKGTFRI